MSTVTTDTATSMLGGGEAAPTSAPTLVSSRSTMVLTIALLIAVTERRTREELDWYVVAMKEALR